ncbi:MAG: hypothetical protein EX285_07705 [Thaumarchaeota archaeon]|nr:hypothetical protein [Nitrososphaerota archaeon]
MYFGHFPLIPYDSVGDGNFKLVTNLLKRVAVRSKVKTNVLVFDTYDLKSGETPELIADKLYNDPELHWVVLMMNDITDRYHQWPLNENQFLAHINDKYSNVDAVHHYEISQTSGDTTIKIDIGTDNTDHSGATAITNYEYEVEQQDKMRKIRLLDPAYIENFVGEYKTLMKASII